MTKTEKRLGLINYMNCSSIFIGEFCTLSSTINGTKTKTFLLKNVRNLKGKILADHLWIQFPSEYEHLIFKPGNLISFIAEGSIYYARHNGNKVRAKYGLQNISHLRIIYS